MSIELVPLPDVQLPPEVKRILSSPPGARAMAARGMAPLRPADLTVLLYQLAFDAEAQVKTAAEAAPSALPEKLFLTALGEALPPAVLHYFGTRLPTSRGEALAKILYNRVTADETYAAMARRLEEREVDIIVNNEERFLRHPAIVEGLYHNKNARMSSINRVIELCVRNGVRVEGIPAFDEIAKSIGADPAATDPAQADVAFDAVMQEAAQVEGTWQSSLSLLDPTQPVDEKIVEKIEEELKKKSAVIDFTKLKLHEKIRLATLGNAYCRQVLMRDSNRVVAMAAIRSPGITEMEVVRASGNRAVCEDVIRYIANKRDYVKMYPVKLNLVQNPKCPLALSLRLLAYLHAEDLKTLSRSKNVPTALSTIARKLAQQRGIS